MIVDGRSIAEDIYKEIAASLQGSAKKPRLVAFTCAPTKETEQFLRLKIKKANAVGIEVSVVEFDQATTTPEVTQSIKAAANNGLIIQLPFPNSIAVDQALAAIPKERDVDVAHYAGGDSDILPPVVGAIKEIAARHGIDFAGKEVAVVGSGKLVGKPAAMWAEAKGGKVSVIDINTPNTDELLRSADIIISGAGVPGLITPEKIKDGVVIFDAGTSEDGGVMKGDVDPACADKCALFTPVPGGIGPITVAVLLRNLVELTKSS